MDALNVGVSPQAFVIRDVIRHEQTGLLVDPKRGVIYGAAGAPVGTACGDGYVRLGRRRDGCQYAHRLVWEVVNGPIPVGLVIDHRNGRRADNRLSNLDMVTQQENVRRAVAVGAAPVGDERTDAKLTSDLVCEIRAGTRSSRSWARELGIHPTTVRAARRGTTWRHVVCRGRCAVKPRRRRRGGAR